MKWSQRMVYFVTEHPWKSFLLGMILLSLFVPGLAKLQTDFSYRIWFKESDPGIQRFDAFERRFGNDETMVVVVHSPSGIYDLESSQLLLQLTKDMWRIPEVIRVDSLSNFNWVHADGDEIQVEPMIPDDRPLDQKILEERLKVSLEHETLPDYLLSRDGKTAIVFANLKPALNGTPDFEKVVLAVRELLKKKDDQGKPLYEGNGDHQFYITGSPAINQAFKESTEHDGRTLVPLIVLVISLFLFMIFRRLSGVALPLIVVFVSILITLGFAGHFKFKMNNMTAMVPQFLIAIGVADAVHILATFFRKLKDGFSKKEAIRLSLDKNILPTLMTSISTAIGFFSFLTAPILPVAYLGFLAGMGTCFAWVITILLLTPLALLLPIKEKIDQEKSMISHAPKRRSLQFTQWIYDYRKAIITTTFILTGIAIYLGLQNTVNSDPFKYFRKDFFLTIATDFLEKNVGGVSAMEMVIDSGKVDGVKDPQWLKKVETLQNYMSANPGITRTISIIDIIKSLNRSLHGGKEEFYKLPEDKATLAQELFLYTMSLPQGMDINNQVTIKNDAIRLTARTDKHNSVEFLKLVTLFEKKAKELGLNAHVTGKNPLYMGMNEDVVISFLVSVALAISLVSLLMIIVFRSIRIGLFAMIPNLIPMVFGGAFVKILGYDLNVGTVLVTSICLGIAVDDTIHFLVNYRRHSLEGMKSQEAVEHIFHSTAPALLITTAILVGGYGTFIFGQFMPNVSFGIMVALVLTLALIMDFIFLPALLMTFNLNFGHVRSKSIRPEDKAMLVED